MWKELMEAVPGGSGVVLGLLVWAGISYGYAGPEAASRVIEFDGHRAACEKGLKERIGRAADAALARIRMPDGVAQKSAMIDQYTNLVNQGQLGAFMRHYGFSGPLGEARQQAREARRESTRAYYAAQDRLKAQRKAAMAGVGDKCACVASEAIAETRVDWAVHVGTIGLVTPQKVKSIRGVMAQVQGRCTAARGAS